MSAERTSRAAVAAEQLCAALWEALHERLSAGDHRQAAELGERIAQVSRAVSGLAAAALDPGGPDSRSADSAADAGSAGSTPEARSAGSATPVEVERQREAGRSAAARNGEESEPEHEATIHPASLGGAMLIDERQAAGAAIAVRDARGERQATPWTAAVQRRLDRHHEDREPFAVLLIEMLDAERLRLTPLRSEFERPLREVEAAIVEQLRPADALVREVDGRYWLIAPGSGAADARAIAHRIDAAARRSASERDARLQVAVGIALCPEHGLDAAALTGRAEVDLYAAQAANRVLGEPRDREPEA